MSNNGTGNSMTKYIVQYHHKGGRITTTVELSEKDAREVWEGDRDYYKGKSAKNYYEKISLCKVEYTEVEAIELV